jgi:hypothetical protein
MIKLGVWDKKCFSYGLELDKYDLKYCFGFQPLLPPFKQIEILLSFLLSARRKAKDMFLMFKLNAYKTLSFALNEAR